MFAHLSPLSVEVKNVDASMRGYVLAEPIVAEYEMPRHASSNVDGYALKGM